MDYTGFTAQDFLLDEYFQNWVLKPDAENEKFWQNWQHHHPAQQPEINKAREFIQSFSVDPVVLPAGKVAQIWENIAASTQEAKVITLASTKNNKKRHITYGYRVAAVIICVLFAGLAIWKMQPPAPQQRVVTTAFGEIRTLTLPDNSQVTLNGNSSLRYPASWSGTAARLVQLQGEAYFSVTHTQVHQPFRVITSGGLRVDVLGTKFVVTSRPQKKRIYLNEGQVKVGVGSNKTRGQATPAEAIMQPGELVELSRAGLLQKKPGQNPDQYTAFLQHKLIFVDTPLAEVARVLEDTYGYTVTFAQPHLAARRFTGSSHPKKINLLLTAIEKSFNLIVVKKGKNLTIKPA